MIEATEAYKAAIIGDSRRIVVRAIIDIVDPNIKYLPVSASSRNKYSNDAQLHDRNLQNPAKYATLERDRWRLDGSFIIYPETPDQKAEYDFQSENLCDAEGNFSPAQFVEMRFSNVSVLQACSVHFPNNSYDGIPTDFTVSVMEGGVERYKENFTANKNSSVFLKGFTVNNPDGIRVTVRKMSIGNRRLRCVEIIAGVFEGWSGDEIADFDLKQKGNVGNTALPFGTCSIRMDNIDRRFEPRNKQGVFRSISERQSIDISMGVELEDGTIEYKRLGLYYQYGNGWKTGDNDVTMHWNLVDIVGLLADREFIVRGSLPTTLDGWARAFVAQLGPNFTSRYTVDPNYKSKPLTAPADAVAGKRIGDLMRFAAMATGTWIRADSETGNLTFEPLWNQGSKITLDNLVKYPTLKANKDIAAVIFDTPSGKITISGNSESASDTVSVKNPFITTREQCLAAARLILSEAGGNRVEISGRGDMTSEIGDVDTIWLDESSATTARRIEQNFSLTDGVLKNAKSVLIQPDGGFLFENKQVINKSGTFKAPPGKTKLRLVLVGRGQSGVAGTDGSWSENGVNGSDGIGGKVWSETVNINEQQEFRVEIGENTVFGAYSSANGKVYPLGYTDIGSGDSYARTGVGSPVNGTGDGGKGGVGGKKGNAHSVCGVDTSGRPVCITVVDNEPTLGSPGSSGAFGCAVVYWDL